MVIEGLKRESLYRLTFDFLHRPGNVHDSNGAEQFLMRFFQKAREANTVFESLIDSAFFDQETMNLLDSAHIQFTASVRFERFPDVLQEAA